MGFLSAAYVNGIFNQTKVMILKVNFGNKKRDGALQEHEVLHGGDTGQEKCLRKLLLDLTSRT
jgi:hypothetical protein